MQIFECVQSILQCEHYKVGQFQRRKDSLCFWLTACKYVWIFKEFATDFKRGFWAV